MFMQSFENTNKQQQRRQQRQLALQRMEEAANVAASGGEEGSATASDVDDDDVDNLHNGDTTGTTGFNHHYVDDNDDVNEEQHHNRPWDRKSTEKTSNTLTSAANFLRESQDSYSFEPATTTAAKQFLWDDQSAYSNGTNRSPQVNLQDIKNMKPPITAGKGTRRDGTRWNSGGRGGLWSALPIWGGGQQVDAESVVSKGSKYRDVEGAQLLSLANDRVKIDNMSALDREFGHIDDNNAVEEDYDSQLRRRVFLDKDGAMGFDDDTAKSLTSRRMRKTCLRTLKRPAMLICAVGVVIAIVSGTASMYNKFMTKDSRVPTIEGESENDSSYEVDEIPPPIPPPSVENGVTELEVDGVKIDVDKKRFDHIRYVILDSQVSTPVAIRDTKSAQFAALLWLVREDPRHMDPYSPLLLQRYGLAVLWFSTTKNNYYHVSEEYLSAQDENGRNLEGQEDMGKWFEHDDWLSELGVCGWTGIECYPHDNGLNHDGNNDGDVMSIDLRRNNLRGAFPSDVFRTLPYLKALDLSDNALAGTISEDIGMMKNLEVFNFTANNIVGSLPDSIGDMSHLKVFHMSFNKLDNTIPYSIYKLEKLRALDLSRNSLVATIPHEIGALKDMNYLNLAYNDLEGPLPHELNNLQSLVELDVSHNKLQSSLPKEIGFLTYLRSLNLSHNEFKGSIPTEFSKLAELDVLNLSNNHFTGLFPTWLTQLNGLKELDISNNGIKGEIPRSIADMKNLKILNLAGNDIVGMIPPELGSLFKLEQISLETNELVGGVPDQLGELTSLRKLALHNNFLTGHVSDHMCKLSNDMFLTQFSVDCAGETAVILCECCQCHLHENIIHLNDGNNRYED